MQGTSVSSVHKSLGLGSLAHFSHVRLQCGQVEVEGKYLQWRVAFPGYWEEIFGKY